MVHVQCEDAPSSPRNKDLGQAVDVSVAGHPKDPSKPWSPPMVRIPRKAGPLKWRITAPPYGQDFARQVSRESDQVALPKRMLGRHLAGAVRKLIRSDPKGTRGWEVPHLCQGPPFDQHF